MTIGKPSAEDETKRHLFHFCHKLTAYFPVHLQKSDLHFPTRETGKYVSFYLF